MKPRRSIKSRLVFSFLAIIGAAFVAIIVAFNISVQEYIDSNAKEELETAREMIIQHDRQEQAEAQLAQFGMRLEKREAGRGPDRLGAEVRVFMWNDGVILKSDPEADPEKEEEIEEKLDVSAALEGVQTINTDQGTFLVRAVRENGIPEGVFILYVDITALENFAESTNMLLFIILVAVGSAAVAVAFALAASIAKPIEQIAGFAGKIGENDFTPVQLELKDRETADLLGVMNQTAEKLAAYDSEQKTFFQNVSHELKTPLMGIQCNAEGIVFRVMDPERAGKKIMQETDRLRDMVDDILFVSKMDTITESEVTEERDLRELLSNSAESQTAAAESKGIEIVYDFSDEPVMLKVSEKNMQRAFSNLISNAIRYARWRIVLTCVAQDGEAVVSVWNDGEKIPDQELPHIYERFYKGTGGQSGIGLAIVKSVVTKAGGTIQVDSTDSGTSFTLRFAEDKTE